MTDTRASSHLAVLIPEEENYRIHARVDILYILRKILQKNTLVTFYFNQNNSFMLTSLLGIDVGTNEMIIDCGLNSRFNQLALASADLTFITSLDRIKIGFSSTRIRAVEYEDRNVFAVEIPHTLVRVQRRRHFRITTPITSPIKCIIPRTDQDKPSKTEITLIDISCGGIGVIEHQPRVSFEPGTMHHNCIINLPEIGRIKATIQVKNTYVMTLKNGKTCKRAGCQFINLPVEMEAMIQRYVTLKEQSQITP